MDPPECKAAPWSRHNHLGNGADDAEPLRYEWKLPHFPSMTQDGEKKPFVLRIRLVKLHFCFDLIDTTSYLKQGLIISHLFVSHTKLI